MYYFLRYQSLVRFLTNKKSVNQKYQPVFICEAVLYIHILYYFFLYSRILCFSWRRFLYSSQPYYFFVFLFFRKILMPFASFFLVHFFVFMIIFSWWILRHFYISENIFIWKIKNKKWFKAFYCIITINFSYVVYISHKIMILWITRKSPENH